MDTPGILAKLKGTGLQVDQSAGARVPPVHSPCAEWRQCTFHVLQSVLVTRLLAACAAPPPPRGCQLMRVSDFGFQHLPPRCLPLSGTRAAARAALTPAVTRIHNHDQAPTCLSLPLHQSVEEIVARVARESAAAAAGQAPAELERGIYNTKDEEQMAALQEWRREMEASCWC